ncbi:ABC transporter permease [Streptomyces sp. NBC_01216]|uniref:ABC transporter permease n=1 Tax=unclassified Streptomyces TaxID=2593676 RepID=UPI002E148F5B|nr:ABC transporter permease [Streptomyces sp. NBC_01216]
MSTPARKGPSLLKGSSWVTVRQHRRALWVAATGVTLSLAVIGGLRWWDARPSAPDGSGSFGALRPAMGYASLGMLVLPLLAGVFVAGPMVARELESGTYRLALTQSVTPTRWLAAKLLTAGTVAITGTLALIGVYQLGLARVDGTYLFHWADRGPYEASGPVLLAQVLLALALGALVGQLVRRTVPAMSSTGLVLGTVILLLGRARWNLLPVRTVTGPPEQPLPVPHDALTLDTGLIGPGGARLPEWTCSEYADPRGCPPGLGITHRYADYHPHAHFWPTQLLETGILLALTGLALYAAFRLLRARHA